MTEAQGEEGESEIAHEVVVVVVVVREWGMGEHKRCQVRQRRGAEDCGTGCCTQDIVGHGGMQSQVQAWLKAAGHKTVDSTFGMDGQVGEAMVRAC